MPLILPGNVASATADAGYTVANSCRFNSADSAYMHKTPGSAGNVDTFTISMWVKRCKLGVSQFLFGTGTSEWNNTFFCRFRNEDDLQFGDFETPAYTWLLQTNRVFRDPSAWMHFVFKVDTTQGTDTNRAKIFINGVQETSFAVSTYPDQNADQKWNNDSLHAIGRVGAYDDDYASLYMAEVASIDGTALDADSFGEFDEDSPTIWKPKDVSGLTFGTNGFYLDFEDSANLGNDANGGTDLTSVNLDATDSATDVPTNNFCVINVLDRNYPSSTLSEGNCKIATTVGAYSYHLGNFALNKGKWFFEVKITSTATYDHVGISDVATANNTTYLYSAPFGYAYRTYDGKFQGKGGSAVAHGDSLTTGDILGVALNLDDNEMNFYKNGVVQNSGTAASIDAASATNYGHYFPAVGEEWGAAAGTYECNFGGCSAFTVSSAVNDENGYGNFEYAPPSGYYALCTKNLAEFG